MKDQKMSKYNKILLPIALLILVLSIAISTRAIYKSGAKGTSTLKTAEWSIKLNDNSITTSNTFSFDLKDALWTHKSNITSDNTKAVMAPGSVGTFGIEIDTEGTEVDVEYNISILVKQNDTEVDLNTINSNITIGVYDGDALKSNPTIGFIAAGESKELAIKINWEDVDTEEANQADINIESNNYTVEVTVTTKQMSNPVTYPTGKNKNTVETGDLVTIGDQEFYVVKHDGDNLVLLTHYNLKVGSIYDSEGIKIGEYTSDDPEYGLQSSDAKGRVALQERDSFGSISFSSSGYWNGKVGTDYPGDYCTYRDGTNCVYVYDSNSNLYQYIEAYKTYVEKTGVKIIEARIMSVEESELLRNANRTAYYETSYWLGSAFNNVDLWGVYNTVLGSLDQYYNDYNLGIRPIIVI